MLSLQSVVGNDDFCFIKGLVKLMNLEKVKFTFFFQTISKYCRYQIRLLYDQ
jgi:hypothetical protein